MVTIALYDLLLPAVAPMALRIFLICRISRTTMMSVRRTLSETEIEKYGTPNLNIEEGFRMPLPGCAVLYMSRMPITISVASTVSVAIGVYGI